MSLSNRKVAMNDAYQTLFDADADNGKAPARSIYIETPSDSSNPTTFKITYKDAVTNEVTLGPGESDTFFAFANEQKRISKVEGKRATSGQASTATWRVQSR